MRFLRRGLATEIEGGTSPSSQLASEAVDIPRQWSIGGIAAPLACGY
jgi:hypothetical protein